MNIVIMAGGGGTRLWPLSRRSNPKQFLDLGSGKTLLEHTYDRAHALTNESDIYVATVADYQARIQDILPLLSPDNIFLEPTRRDTAAAFAAACLQLTERGEADVPTIFMWSDHVFTNEAEFVGDLKKVPELLAQNPESIIIFGHTPTSPETGFGYIEVGEKVPGYSDVFRVASFKEKPDRATAEQYVADKKYFWNMAYISTQPAYLLAQLTAHAPNLMAKANTLLPAIAARDDKEFARIYADLPAIAIDYAVLEKAPAILTVTGDYGWSDVGNWAAVQEIFGVKGDHVPHGHHIHVDSEDNYVYNATDKTVSLIGITNCIVVVTEDAILVTDKGASHKVKDVVKRLEEAKSERL